SSGPCSQTATSTSTTFGICCLQRCRCLQGPRGWRAVTGTRGKSSTRKSYPRVAMMQSGKDRYGDDNPGSLNCPPPRSVLPQTQMCARFIVIDRLQVQDPAPGLLAQDQDMIQAIAAQRPYQASNIWILPG